MSDWRIPQEYLDQSKRIEELEAALAKSCEDGRNEMYDCGYNALKAENAKLLDAIQTYVTDYDNDSESICTLRKALAEVE